MPEYNPSQLQSVLSSIHDAQREALSRSTTVEGGRLRGDRRELQKLLRASLAKAGVDIDAVEKGINDSHAQLRAVVDRHHADAVKRSSHTRAATLAAIEGRRKGIERIKALNAGAAAATFVQPFFFDLDTASQVSSSGVIALDASSIQAWNNLARFQLHSSGDGSGEVIFSFIWQNPSSRFAVANVDGYLILDGFCQAGSGSGTFPGDRQSSLTIDVRLDILETWNQPPTSPLAQFGQSQNAITLKTDTGGWADPGAIEFRDLFRGYDLRHELFVVEPNGVAVFNTTVAVTFGNSDGAIVADFSTGDFHVMSPFVLVGVVS